MACGLLLHHQDAFPLFFLRCEKAAQGLLGEAVASGSEKAIILSALALKRCVLVYRLENSYFRYIKGSTHLQKEKGAGGLIMTPAQFVFFFAQCRQVLRKVSFP